MMTAIEIFDEKMAKAERLYETDYPVPETIIAWDKKNRDATRNNARKWIEAHPDVKILLTLVDVISNQVALFYSDNMDDYGRGQMALFTPVHYWEFDAPAYPMSLNADNAKCL